MTIVEFLEARLDEDEETARVFGDGSAPDDSQATHIVRYSPDRVLREVAAKRSLVELYGALSAQWAPNVDYGFAYTTLRTLAAIYSSHPDYRQEWAQ